VGGGAISSFLLALLARVPGVRRISLVDPDRYTESNLRTQNIFPGDVGEYKVAALARRLRVFDPRLEVVAYPLAVEDVPLGLLRADIILAGLDTKIARQSVNQVAFWLSCPWADAGVLASEHLARVNVYSPAADSACLECAWSASDYAALEIAFPCGAGIAAPGSDTSAVVASMAATLQANEAEKMLCGNQQYAAIGRQVTVDVRTHRMFSTTLHRNPNCRLDHAAFAIVPLSCSLRRMTIAEALAVVGRMRVPGHRFVRATVCPLCGFRLDGLRLDRPKARCPRCGVPMVAPGFDAMLEQLDVLLPAEEQRRSLAQIGLCARDVVCGTEKQFELMEVM
jgi:molybdopterin/thiamine biosynthesis adenylyltransferase